MKTIFRNFIALLVCVSMAGAQSIAFPGPGAASNSTGAVARVQSVRGLVCGSAGTTCAAPVFGSAQLSTSINVVCASWEATTGTGFSLASVADTKLNTYTVITASKFTVLATAHYTELGVECAYTTGTVAAGTNTVTCTFSGGAHYEYCNAFELSGAAATSLANTSGTGNNGAGTAISAGSYTTLINGEFLITMIAIDDGIGSPGFLVAGSGFTMDQNTGTANHETGDEYQAQAASGAVTGAMTAGGTGTWIATMVAFHP